MQIILLYIVSQDLLAASTMISYYIPFIGTIYFRTVLVAILLVMVSDRIRNKSFKPKSSIMWISILVGSLFLFLSVESLLMIINGGNSSRMTKYTIGFLMKIITILIVWFYANARFKNKKEVLRFILKPYCYFSIYVAFTGLLAWILAVFNLIEPSSWQLPADMLSRDYQQDYSYGTIYSFPYYLGLVTTGREIDLLGLPVFRATGLFHEGTYAAFFVLPAFFYIPFLFEGSGSKLKWRLSNILILLFAVATYSSAGILAFSISLSVGIINYLQMSKFNIKSFLVIIGLVILASFVMLLFTYESGTFYRKFLLFPFYIENSMGIIDSNSLFGDGFFAIKHDFDGLARFYVPRAILSTLFQAIHIFIVLTLLLKMLFSRNHHKFLCISMLYTFIHSFKVLLFLQFTGLYMFQLFIFALILSLSSKTITYTYQNTTKPLKHGSVNVSL